MSDILDWLERISELFILKLLTLGAWSKAYEQYRTTKIYEDYLHDQSIDELIEFRDLIVRAFEDLLHSQSVDELVNIYSIEANVTLILDLLYDLTTTSTDLTLLIVNPSVDATTSSNDLTLSMDLNVETVVS
jgi:hypothetical protein